MLSNRERLIPTLISFSVIASAILVSLGILNWGFISNYVRSTIERIQEGDVLGITDWGETTLVTDADASFVASSTSPQPSNMAALGDVNGDSIDDFAIARRDECGGNGAIYIFFGSATGWSLDMADTDADASFCAGAGDSAYYVQGPGDINGDGYNDILISGPGNDEVDTNSGEVYLVYGKGSGWGSSVDLSTNADASFRGINSNDLAIGWKLGDINGDTYADFGIQSINVDIGKVSIFFGSDSPSWTLNDSISSADLTYTGIGEGEGTYLVREIGDLNNDGYDDIAIGSSGYFTGGGVFIIFGMSSGWSTSGNVSALADASYQAEVFSGNDNAVIATRAGDVNGDGIDDFVISASATSPTVNSYGRAYVIFGKTSGWSTGVNLSGADVIYEVTYDFTGTFHSGVTAAYVGDVNDDGYDDLYFGNQGDHGVYIANYGNMNYLVFGRDSGWFSGSELEDVADNLFSGVEYQEFVGQVAGAGDINNDGVPDLLMTGNGTGGYRETYLFFSLGNTPGCPDGDIDPGEVCDGSELDGETCVTQGYVAGTLACSGDCLSYDTSSCVETNPCILEEVCSGTFYMPETGWWSDDPDCAGVSACDAYYGETQLPHYSVQVFIGEGYETWYTDDPDCDGITYADNYTYEPDSSYCSDEFSSCDAFWPDGDYDPSYGICGDALPNVAYCNVSDGCDCWWAEDTCETCGSDTVEPGEVCDGIDLNEETCVTQGYDSGTLACQEGCLAFDYSSCVGAVCPNDYIDVGEECDTDQLDGETCVTQGFLWGTLACSASCEFDNSGCSNTSPCESQEDVCGGTQYTPEDGWWSDDSDCSGAGACDTYYAEEAPSFCPTGDVITALDGETTWWTDDTDCLATGICDYTYPDGPGEGDEDFCGMEDGCDCWWDTEPVPVASADPVLGTAYEFENPDSQSLVADQSFLDSTHLVVTDYGYARVATLSGDTITYGDYYDIDDVPMLDNHHRVSALTSSSFVVAYREAWETAHDLYVKIGTVSGDTISFGSEHVYQEAYTSLVDVAALDSTHFVMIYDLNYEEFYAVIGTVSGTNISWGTPVQFYTPYTYPPTAEVEKLDSTHFIIMHNECRVIAGEVSGTAITFGTGQSFSCNSSSSVSVDTISSSKAVVAYENTIDFDEYGVMRDITISGTSITLGTEYPFTPGGSTDDKSKFSVAAMNASHVAIGYSTTYSGNNVVIGTLTDTTWNFGDTVVFTTDTNTHTWQWFDLETQDTTHYTVAYGYYPNVRRGTYSANNLRDSGTCDIGDGCDCWWETSVDCVGCGNNITDGAEVCDGTDLEGESCITQGFDSGTLACSVGCDAFDTSACEVGGGEVCGNDTVEGAEVCDGTDLDSETCVTQGFDAGTLACAVGCAAFDESGCYDYACGNNIIEGSEVCDGTSLSGETCISQGYLGGSLTCLSNCTGYNTSACYSGICGDDIVSGSENCDDGNTTDGDGCDSSCQIEMECPAGTVEELTVPFNQLAYTSTANTYTGNVQMTVIGAGKASGIALNDPFYIYTHYSTGAPITPIIQNPFNLYFSSMSLSQQIVTTPVYNVIHNYSVTLPVYSGQKLDFRIGDSYPDDNTGEILVCITGITPLCGNNVIEGIEVCDGSALNGESCPTKGYVAGTLRCNDACSGYDESACNFCGNNLIDGAEPCDGTELSGKTCEDFGRLEGTIRCWWDCTGFDLRACPTPYVEPVCSDGVDNDEDGIVDYPFDLGCTSEDDEDELDPAVAPVCSDGIDNDEDGLADFPWDPGCSSASDTNEVNPSVLPECFDREDNDIDFTIDFPLDRGCYAASDDDEENPSENYECNDGVDNDGDGLIDFPFDPGCSYPFDRYEVDLGITPACSDSSDNDGDGQTDFPNDPGCVSAADDNELDSIIVPECSDSVDNNRDDEIDYPDDDECYAASDPAEGVSITEVCNDGVDNDGDGYEDCRDSDCAEDSGCVSGENCYDGLDNDGDCFVDCIDSDCFEFQICEQNAESSCNNGFDDDGDGYSDCLDVDCSDFSACSESYDSEICFNKLDDDGDGFADCLDSSCLNYQACVSCGGEFCNDNVDNDGDGLIDCDDTQCENQEGCGGISNLPITGTIENIGRGVSTIAPVSIPVSTAVGILQVMSITPALGYGEMFNTFLSSIANSLKTGNISDIVKSPVTGAVGLTSSNFFTRIYGIFTSFFKKKRKPWGFVYDANTRSPIAFVVVDILNKEGLHITSTVSDLEGRFYLFLDRGVYSLSLKHGEYRFIPKEGKVTENLYNGGTFDVVGTESVGFDVPMYPKEYTGGVLLAYAKIRNTTRKFFNKYRWIISVLGLILSVVSVIFSPSIWTFIMLCLYLFSIVWNFLATKDPKKWGRVLDNNSNQPIPYAKVEIFNDKNEVLDSQLSDEKGRFGFFDDYSGNYVQVTAVGYDVPEERIKVKKGFRKDLFLNKSESAQGVATPFGS